MPWLPPSFAFPAHLVAQGLTLPNRPWPSPVFYPFSIYPIKYVFWSLWTETLSSAEIFTPLSRYGNWPNEQDSVTFTAPASSSSWNIIPRMMQAVCLVCSFLPLQLWPHVPSSGLWVHITSVSEHHPCMFLAQDFYFLLSLPLPRTDQLSFHLPGMCLQELLESAIFVFWVGISRPLFCL